MCAIVYLISPSLQSFAYTAFHPSSSASEWSAHKHSGGENTSHAGFRHAAGLGWRGDADVGKFERNNGL